MHGRRGPGGVRGGRRGGLPGVALASFELRGNEIEFRDPVDAEADRALVRLFGLPALDVRELAADLATELVRDLVTTRRRRSRRPPRCIEKRRMSDLFDELVGRFMSKREAAEMMEACGRMSASSARREDTRCGCPHGRGVGGSNHGRRGRCKPRSQAIFSAREIRKGGVEAPSVRGGDEEEAGSHRQEFDAAAVAAAAGRAGRSSARTAPVRPRIPHRQQGTRSGRRVAARSPAHSRARRYSGTRSR